MKCLICAGGTRYFFSKTFNAFGLTRVDYFRCGDCGFVLSGTHAGMSESEWKALNHAYHTGYQNTDSNPDDPRWLARLHSQARVIDDATGLGLLKRGGRWLDYACGDGKLSDLLAQGEHRLLKYDRYMTGGADELSEEDLVPRRFDFLITTSVFEHFIRREQFDACEALVSADGVLGVHTLVSETVPCDPSWFYLLPVHCAFHTNASMSRLFRDWNYRASVYDVDSRLWLWFKKPPADLEKRVETAASRQDKPAYIFKNGFVDYWK